MTSEVRGRRTTVTSGVRGKDYSDLRSQGEHHSDLRSQVEDSEVRGRTTVTSEVSGGLQ